MASPKPTPDPHPDTDDFWTLPPDASANVLDEARYERIERQPGVIVHRRNDALANKPVTPITTVGHMTVAELPRLLGRDPDYEEDNAWSAGGDDPNPASGEIR